MWSQSSLFADAERPYTVSELTGQIRARLEQDPILQNLWVTGEVSNVSQPASGHIYFTLKDAGSQLGCVIWRSAVPNLETLPRHGDRVVAHGRIGIYEQGGRYQFYADQVQPAGRGALYQEYERLKAQLEAEGLFDAARKQPLPSYPQRIGIVTSATAAALRDVLNVLRRRYPLAEVLLAPTLVQGPLAPPQIVAALAALNARDDVDVILMVRGGGSLEDLWAFNDEQVARAVAASRLPVISGVGHETDFSLADFAADRRAPTPSAAAELATPDQFALRAQLRQQQTALERTATAFLEAQRARLTQLERTQSYFAPTVRVANYRQRLDELSARRERIGATLLARRRERLAALHARLAALDPHAVLQRGYALVRDTATGQVVVERAGLRMKQALAVQFRDGEITATVGEIAD